MRLRSGLIKFKMDEIKEMFVKLERDLTEKFDAKLKLIGNQINIIDEKLDKNRVACNNCRVEMLQIIEKRCEPVDLEINSVVKEIGEASKAIIVVDNEVGQLKSELCQLKTQIESGPKNKGGFGNQTVFTNLDRKAPSFDNKKKGEHPVKFLKTLDIYLSRINLSENLKVPTAIECLEGDTKIWAERHSGRWVNYNDFKIAFTNEFWSQKVQNKARLEIYEQRTYKSSQGTMTHHVWSWINRTQYLVPSLPEESFVDAVSKHFARDIELHLLTSRIKTIDEFLKIIEDLDEATKNTNRGYESNNRFAAMGSYERSNTNRENFRPEIRYSNNRNQSRETNVVRPGVNRNIDRETVASIQRPITPVNQETNNTPTSEN